MLSERAFFHDDCFKGMGISEGLARGLQVMIDGMNLTQEGIQYRCKYVPRTVH
jgi:hypothetical protein